MQKTKTTNGQPVENFVQQAWVIEWFLFLNKFQDDQSMSRNNNSLTYYKTTHKIRIPKGYDIKRWDKVTNQSWEEFIVKYSYKQPGFNGEVDHLLLYVDLIDG